MSSYVAPARTQNKMSATCLKQRRTILSTNLTFNERRRSLEYLEMRLYLRSNPGLLVLGRWALLSDSATMIPGRRQQALLSAYLPRICTMFGYCSLPSFESRGKLSASFSTFEVLSQRHNLYMNNKCSDTLRAALEIS